MTRQAAVLARPHRRTSIEWMDRALCADLPQFTEWPIGDQVAFCRSGCPVMSECGVYAVAGPPAWDTHDGTVGVVYGGMRPATIKRLQKQRQAVA